MNVDGTRLASASVKGTLIRIFDTETGRLLHELRRGADRAEIWSLAFSGDSSRIVLASDKGTVHVFNVGDGHEGGGGGGGGGGAIPLPPATTHSEQLVQEWTNVEAVLGESSAQGVADYAQSRRSGGGGGGGAPRDQQASPYDDRVFSTSAPVSFGGGLSSLGGRNIVVS